MGVVYENRRTTYLNQESSAYVELQTFSAGVYLFKLDLKGNSLLSTLYLKTLGGASVQVEHFNYTTDEGLEEHHLNTHPILTGTGISKVLVGNTHNAVVCRITVSGGSAELSLYGTSVSTYANITEAVPSIFDEQVANLLSDKAVPTAYYNEETGKWVIARGGVDGSLEVTGTFTTVSLGTWLYSTVSCLDSGWTKVVVSPLLERLHLAVQNNSDKLVRINSVEAGTWVGEIIYPGGFSVKSADASAVFYVRTEPGGGTVVLDVEEGKV